MASTNREEHGTMILFQIQAKVARKSDLELATNRLRAVLAEQLGIDLCWLRAGGSPSKRGGTVRIQVERDWRFTRDELSTIVSNTSKTIDSDRWLIDTLDEYHVQGNGPAPEGSTVPLMAFSTGDYRYGLREERLAELAEAAR